jgi:photosystem II stability/assembly factor-like uncharacterized protein
MKKKHITLIMFLAVLMNACETQQLSTPDAYSQTPPPFIYTDSTTSALTQPNLPQTQSSDTRIPLANNTPFVSPTIEVFDTPTFSPTFTPMPTLKPDQAIPLINIYMMTESSGWGVEENGHIVHTKDGGTTWNDVTPPQGAYIENGFFALDDQTAWATPYCFGYPIGHGYYCEKETNQTNVWTTHDGGTTWFASLPICLDFRCNDLISSGGGYISLLPESIRFIDAQHGWFVISRGSHMEQDSYNGFYTSDGGKSWNFLVSEFTNDIVPGLVTALEPLDGKNTFLFFHPPHEQEVGNNLLYFQSNDGGKKWNKFAYFALPTNPIDDPAWDNLDCGTIESNAISLLVLDLTQECHYFNENYQYIYYFVHLQSENGGKTWNYWQQTGDVDFINAKTGWQLVAQGDPAHELQQTHDGGLTWVKVKTVEWDGVLNFVNDQIGYALAYNQGVMAVMHTADGGKTWEIKSQATLTHVPCLISTWSICDW